MTDHRAAGPARADGPRPGLYQRLFLSLTAPQDASGLAVFRVALGLIGAVSAVRFLAYGWVHELFVRPRMYFSYHGFEWVRALPPAAMYALFIGLAVASLLVAIGLFYRAAIVFFFLAFSYVQLIDVTNYLNHYYLVSLLAGLMALLPMNAAWSLDARLSPRSRRDHVPAYAYHLLRFQVAVVYIFAGLAKVNADWLLHGQPLGVWLASRTGTPLLGPLFTLPGAAIVMSWAGCLFDLTIALWLSIPRARPYAYAMVIVFHAVTSALFPIGMFPFIMAAAALIFFPAGAARALWGRARSLVRSPARGPLPPPLREAPRRVPRAFAVGLAVFAVYAAFQITFPLRAHLYSGDVSWHEQGMRWSWRVMLREKNASVTYYVTNPRTGKVTEVSPRRYLTPRQERDFATQPDLLLQLGKRIAADHAARDGVKVVVTVDALVSLNGRRAARLIDPDADLARIEDGLAPAPWILPAPEEPPPHLSPVALR